MKKCSTCKEILPLSMFCKRQKAKDGLQWYCRECDRKYCLKWREKHRDVMRAQYRKSDQKRKEKANKYRREVVSRLKKTAREAVKYAVRVGKLKKPDHCSFCAVKPTKIEGHHTDYSKKLEVIWLCGVCHMRLHHGIGQK